jgi:2-C-methyl-D-erythritol 4-phosphate cytidylyltransferase
MKGGIKKEYRLLRDKPILYWSLMPFIQTDLFDSLVVTVPAGDCSIVRELLSAYIDVSSIIFVDGGKTRQESVYFALLSLEKVAPEFILIHDGARPWITQEIILHVLEGTQKAGACIPVIEASDALKEINGHNMIHRHLERGTTVCAQTPQGFVFSDIFTAHKAARKEDKLFIDDSEIYARFIGPVLAVPGSFENRKITYEQDLIK